MFNLSCVIIKKKTHHLNKQHTKDTWYLTSVENVISVTMSVKKI